MRQARNEESLALVQLEIPPSFSHSDLAVWQKLTQGSALTYLAKYQEAHTVLSLAQGLADNWQPQLIGEALLRRGTLASLERNLIQAQALFHSCLEFARLHKDEYLEASALGSLGLVAARMDHYDESIVWNQQALELDKTNGWLGLAARAEGNMGWSYYLIGDLVNALDLYKKANQHDIDAGVPERRITWLNGAGDVYYDMHDYSAAESASASAFQLADSLHDQDDAIYCLQNLALISLARNQVDSATKYVRDALDRESSGPDHVRELYTRLISAQLAAKTGDYDNAERVFTQVRDDPASPIYVHWEALSGLAQTHASQGKNALAEREFQEAISTISSAQDSIEQEEFRLSFLSIAIRFYDEYVSFLLNLNRPIEALKIADRSRAQTLEHGLSSGTNEKATRAAAFNPQQIAHSQNATLLFYWLGQHSSHLWVISPTKTTLLRLPSGAEIDAAAKSYRKSFLDPIDPLEAGNVYGKKLYEILVRPAEKLIPKNSQVIILPDSSLNGLNFETLIVSDAKPHYWIEDVTISIANSLWLLSRAHRTSPPKNPSLLFFGDALQASKNFPPLADSGKDLTAVGKYFPESRRTIFTGARAKASNYLPGNPGQYSYIHFSTHGIASTSHPLESAIILSQEGDSFKLYARDIVQRPLNAYLVSISACSGSGERVLAGEGLVGLSWAFLRAGAHNVVASLWDVSSASTPLLMDDLYKGIFDGQDPATALRNAKLALVHSKGPFHRPFYWAPFELYTGS